MWIFVVVLLGLSVPVVGLAVPQELAKGNWPVLLALLFPLAGLWLLHVAVLKTLEWRRFGCLYLDLDPFPGSLGGDAGGVVELAEPYSKNIRFDITLSCVHAWVLGHGSDRRRHEKVLWRGRAGVPGEPGMRGTRVRFRFAVPEHLPQSEPVSDDYHYWAVHLMADLSGVDLDRTFEIPVFHTEEPLRSRQRVPYAAEAAALEPPGSVVRVYRGADCLRLDYPSSRSRGIGLAISSVGLFFLGAPIAIGMGSGWLGMPGQLGLSIGTLAGAGIMSLVFGLVGLGISLVGLYVMTNSLQVQVSGQEILTCRRLFGVPIRERAVPFEQVTGVDHHIAMQTGQGARATVRYSIDVHLRDGGKLCLGDGLRGRPLADHVLNLIRGTGRFGDSAATRRLLPGEMAVASGVRVPYRNKSSIRWAGALFALVLFASFAYEAFSMFVR